MALPINFKDYRPLPTDYVFQDTDLVLVQSANDREAKYMTWARFTSLIGGGGGGGGTWGSITGTLSAQTDLNSALAGKQAVSTKVVYTSSVGAISDADLSHQSITFGTDNTTVLQALLDTATASNPLHIIWDGKYSVTGLDIKSYTKIVALPGCGAILRNHSNRSLISNKNRRRANESIIDVNIEICGGIWNGNGYNPGPQGNDLIFAPFPNTGGSAQYKYTTEWGLVHVMDFAGVNGLILRDLSIWESVCYSLWGMNVFNVHVDNVKAEMELTSIRYLYNYDGLHFQGPAENIYVRNFYARNLKDDSIVFTADEREAPEIPTFQYYTVDAGPIRNVNVDGVIGTGTIGLRLLSCGNALENVTIRNMFGAYTEHVIKIDNYNALSTMTTVGNGVIRGLLIENVVATLSASAGLAYIYLNTAGEDFKFRNITRRDFTTTYKTFYLGVDTDIDILSIDGIFEINPGSVAHSIIENHGDVRVLKINNANYTGIDATETPLVKHVEGTVHRIALSNIDHNYANNVVLQTGGTLNSISAIGIVHSNTEEATFETNQTINDVVLSNYYGLAQVTGTFSNQRGDGFDTIVILPSGFTDTFNRADGPIGNSWSTPIGAFNILTNKAYAVTSSAGDVFCSHETNLSNGVITWAYFPPALTFFCNAGFVFRYADNNNLMFLQLTSIDKNAGTFQMKLYKKVATVYTQLGSTTTVTINIGVSNPIVITLAGTAITTNINGSDIGGLSGTFSTGLETNTRHGMYAYKSADGFNDAGSTFDSFSAVE
jgi:hypothetical protein